MKYVTVGLAGFSRRTVDYIVNLIGCNMEHSYFKEPTGICTYIKRYLGFQWGM